MIGYSHSAITLATDKLKMLHDVMETGSCSLQFLFGGIIKVSIVISTFYSLL